MAGWVWAVVAGLAFGVSQITNRGLNREIDAFRAATAMVTSMLVFLVVAVIATGELAALPAITPLAVFWFVGAGLVHFLVGWTLFAGSQQRIGSSRTASILSTNPVMAAVIAWLALAERLQPITWAGVVAVTAGVALVAGGRPNGGRWNNPTLALLTTLCFSISPLFVRWGLDAFDHPLLGLTVGMAVTVPVMHASSRLITGEAVRVPPSGRRWLIGGGLLAAIAITAQWTAFARIPVGVAISLQQLTTPVVLFLGPILLSTPAERPSRRLVVGTALVVAGSVVVALFGRSL